MKIYFNISDDIVDVLQHVQQANMRQNACGNQCLCQDSRSILSVAVLGNKNNYVRDLFCDLHFCLDVTV